MTSFAESVPPSERPPEGLDAVRLSAPPGADRPPSRLMADPDAEPIMAMLLAVTVPGIASAELVAREKLEPVTEKSAREAILFVDCARATGPSAPALLRSVLADTKLPDCVMPPLPAERSSVPPGAVSGPERAMPPAGLGAAMVITPPALVAMDPVTAIALVLAAVPRRVTFPARMFPATMSGDESARIRSALGTENGPSEVMLFPA